VLGNGGLAHLEEVEPPLQDVTERGLGQLLEEFLADLGKEGWDLVFVFLLLETSVVENN
jgi:hypothetical protein